MIGDSDGLGLPSADAEMRLFRRVLSPLGEH